MSPIESGTKYWRWAKRSAHTNTPEALVAGREGTEARGGHVRLKNRDRAERRLSGRDAQGFKGNEKRVRVGYTVQCYGYMHCSWYV